MERRSVEAIISALNEAGARYLVAGTEVDLFVESPLDFDRAYAAAARMEIAPGVEATFVGLEDLLRLKRQSGRPQDLDDVRHLSDLRGDA